MAGFSRLASNNAGLKSLAGVSETTAPIRYIAVTEICPRFENKYITNLDKAQSLQKSIIDVGLIEPINIVDINKYIEFRNSENELSDSAKNEIEYLQQMQQRGIRFFITSGHRRFKAYISVFLQKDINTDEEWNQNYDFLKETYDKVKAESTELFLKGQTNEREKWLSIPTIVEEKNFDKETIFYNDSNTTQRELTGFEIITNTIDELQTTGQWDTFVADICSKRVDAMTDRKVKERVNDLIKQGVISSDSYNDTIQEKRNLLKSLGSKYVPGVNKMIDKYIVNYIYENKKRTVSAQNVMYSRTLLETFDQELIQTIFDGYLNFATAKEILPIYEKLDIKETVSKIKKRTFKIENVKRKTDSVKFTSRQLIELIYDIKSGVKTVDEVIRMIEQAEINNNHA